MANTILLNRPIGGVLAFLLLACTVSAQTPPSREVSTDADVSRRDMVSGITGRLFAPEPAFAPPSPSDNDLGEQRILVPDERYKAFTIFANASEFYTSNAQLSNSGGQSDWLTAIQLGASWIPRITGNLFGEATAMQQFFRYAEDGGLNFNSLDLGGGLIYVLRDLEDLSFFARYNWNMLTDGGAGDVIFEQQTIRLGLQKPFVFSRAHSAVVSFQTDLNLAGFPDYSLRNRFALLGGYQANLTRHVQANLFYQIAYLPFAEVSRQDLNQILSAGLAWNFNEQFSINASVSASFNESNESFFTYSVLNTGGGVSAVFKF
jgi:hypothetical protein